MSGMLSQWMSALRDHLHLSAIERDIVEIRKAMENQEHRTGAGQALLANQQQHLEGTISALDNAMRELGALVADERSRKDEVELKLSGSVAQLTNEIRRLCDVVDEHLRATILKQYDK